MQAGWSSVQETDKSELLNRLLNCPNTVVFCSSKTPLFPIQMIYSIKNEIISFKLIICDEKLEEYSLQRYKDICLAGMKMNNDLTET